MRWISRLVALAIAAGPVLAADADDVWDRVDHHFASNGDVKIHYATLGQGKPIVFVHGLGGCWRNWLENLPHLGRRHRAIALDLPGFGASPMPDWQISVAAYGRLLHDFCAKLGSLAVCCRMRSVRFAAGGKVPSG